MHIFFAVWTSVENRSARGQQYAYPLCDDKQKLGSSFMLVTGVLLIFFVILVNLEEFSWDIKDSNLPDATKKMTIQRLYSSDY